MANQSQPYRLQWPLTPSQVEGLDTMLEILFKRLRLLETTPGVTTTATAVPAALSSAVFGPPGDPGEDGTQGFPGAPGVTGAVGPRGVPGADGEDGDVGPPGPPGAPGATGATGASGTGGGVMGPPGQDGESADTFSLPFFPPPGEALGCIAYRATGDQTVPDSTVGVNFYPVEFDTDEYDPASMHDTSSNTSRIQIPVGGRYLVTYEGLFSASSTGQRVVRVRKNGTTDLLGGGFFSGSPSGTWAQSVVVASTYLLAAGDYIEIMVYQNSGISLTLYGSAFYFTSRVSVMKVG